MNAGEGVEKREPCYTIEEYKLIHCGSGLGSD